MKNDPAFPRTYIGRSPEIQMQTPGLTKRELFAAMAMQGFLATVNEDFDSEPTRVQREHQMAAARWCVGYADALLSALEQGEGE